MADTVPEDEIQDNEEKLQNNIPEVSPRQRPPPSRTKPEKQKTIYMGVDNIPLEDIFKKTDIVGTTPRQGPKSGPVNSARQKSRNMRANGIRSEAFFQKKGKKKAKPNQLQNNWIDIIDKHCNEKVTEYMKTVRELRTEEKTLSGNEIVAGTSTYKSNGRNIVRLPVLKVWEDRNLGARKFVLGTPSRTDPQKSILILGTKGCGKSTLIDCMVNRALGVNWDDNFTLRVTDPEDESSDIGSKWINVYSIPSTSQTAMPFCINLVEVPGMSAVRENQSDEDVIENLKRFMKNPEGHGIDSFSGIWFVYQAHQQTVPSVYKRLYKELHEMYGRAADESISSLITFRKELIEYPVIKAIGETGMPNTNVIYFNNMLVFNKAQANPYSNANQLEEKLEEEWQCSQDGLDSLSGKAESAQPFSSVISTEDLEKREKATEGLRQLNTLIRMGCQKLQSMEYEKQMIQDNVADEKQVICHVPDFQYEICKPVKKKRKLPYCGEQVTNCSVCFVTCHANCAVVDDDAKAQCCAMGPDGFCRQCPGKCYWDQHYNRAFQIFLRMEKTMKKFSELPKEFNIDENKRVGELLEAMQSQSGLAQENVTNNIKKAVENMAVINEISGRKVPKSYEDCIDIIIHEEKRDGMPEWEKRVDILQLLKQEGQLGVRIAGKEDKEKLL